VSERTIHSEKALKIALKSTDKPSHNTCLNYVPTRRQTKRDIQKTSIFAPTAGTRSSISPKLCMLKENVVTILKDVNHFSIQCIVFRLDAIAWSVIATATWLGGWVAGWVGGCLPQPPPVLYQND